MKIRTIYDVLNQVMDDYSYSIKKVGKKVEVSGSVYIERLDLDVKHEKTIYLADKDNIGNLEKAVKVFKEELKEKVIEVIKSHAEELTDDEEMINKLQYELKSLKKTLAECEEELAKANERIKQLEAEKLTTYPWINPNPWSTGITYQTEIGDAPDWMDKNRITCEENANSSCTDINFNREWVQHTLHEGEPPITHRWYNKKNGEA